MMKMSTYDRLVSCFRTVFPALDDQEIAQASIASLAKWDSLATVTLVSVIEEEFGIEVKDTDLENFVSFDLIAETLTEYDESA